jgi:hypothetical protein
MRGENIILGIIGLTFLYISHLLQTSRLRLSWEGFQGEAKPDTSEDAADMKIVADIQKLCAGPQDKESILKGIKEVRAKQMTTALTESMGLGTKEGFQSRLNPYNEPSPNTQQSFEFRLGRMSMIN